jgi:hypothetical protein
VSPAPGHTPDVTQAHQVYICLFIHEIIDGGETLANICVLRALPPETTSS